MTSESSGLPLSPLQNMSNLYIHFFYILFLKSQKGSRIPDTKHNFSKTQMKPRKDCEVPCDQSRSRMVQVLRYINKYSQREEEALTTGGENVGCWWIPGLCLSVTGLRYCLSLQPDPLNCLLASFIGQKPSPQKCQLMNADLCHKTEKKAP